MDTNSAGKVVAVFTHLDDAHKYFQSFADAVCEAFGITSDHFIASSSYTYILENNEQRAEIVVKKAPVGREYFWVTFRIRENETSKSITMSQEGIVSDQGHITGVEANSFIDSWFKIAADITFKRAAALNNVVTDFLAKKASFADLRKAAGTK